MSKGNSSMSAVFMLLEDLPYYDVLSSAESTVP